ncbi:UNVERIFIED_CONTAM: hypothetical protein Sindi_2776100, partial [Sesamum indicum]
LGMVTDYTTLSWTWCLTTIYGPSPNGQQSLAPNSTIWCYLELSAHFHQHSTGNCPSHTRNIG